MLYIVATPIGNLEDITFRAVRILKEVDLILAEDTRKTGLLLKRLDIKKKMVSFFEHSEVKKIPWLVEELSDGKNIALVSSAGTPTISDPGYRLVRECRRLNLTVTSLPGASSVINALALSSIPHEKFIFLGYIPKKATQCKKLLNNVKDWGLTVVFFESPYRLINSLERIKEIFGNRKVAVMREMTKKFEEVKESEIEEVLLHFSNKKPKGEMVLVISAAE